jgi:hypothetical protein
MLKFSLFIIHKNLSNYIWNIYYIWRLSRKNGDELSTQFFSICIFKGLVLFQQYVAFKIMQFNNFKVFILK